MGQTLKPRLKVAFLSNGGVFGDIVLRGILASSGLQVVGVVQSRRVFKKELGFLAGAFHFFSRCGTFYTVYIWIVTTFAEWMAFISGVGGILARCRREGIPVLRTRDINQKEGIGFLKSIGAELLIAAHFDQKLLPPLCDGQEFAAVNLHPSLLPLHKGLEPVLRCLAAGDSMVGATLHRLSPNIDCGPVVDSIRIPAAELSGRSIFSVTCELMRLGASLIQRNLDRLPNAGLGETQNGPSSYHSWPHSQEVWLFLRNGGKFLSLFELATLLCLIKKSRYSGNEVSRHPIN